MGNVSATPSQPTSQVHAQPTSQVHAQPTSQVHAQPGLLPATGHALLHRIARGQREGRAPSLVAAAVRDGHLVWSGARGEVDGRPPGVDVQYRIGSLTKTFTAILVLRLRDEGRLELTDPLERHLPGTAAGQATIAQLLAHTAGLASEPAGPWWERTPGTLRPDLARLLGEDPARHPAGRRFHYSNPGYALLGALVAQLRGRPWEDVLHAEITGPLGMPSTASRPAPGHAAGWAVHPWADVLLPEPAEEYGLMAPAGQLWSTAADLCRLAVLLASGANAPSTGHGPVLAASTAAEMREPAAPGPEDRECGYGLGLELLRRGGRLLVGHTGSVPGFLAKLWVDPDSGDGAVVLANATAGPEVGAIAEDIVTILAEREPRIPSAWRASSDADPDLLALTGPWYWGPTGYTLQLRTGRDLELVPMATGGRRVRLRPAADGTWTGLDGYFAGETLRVERDTGGTVTHLDIGTFVFTRQPYHPGAPVPGGVDPRGWRSGP